MHPILFEIGGFPVYTYGVLLAAAYLLGLQFALVRAERAGSIRTGSWISGIWIIISALVGAKLLLLIVDFDTFGEVRPSCCTLLRSAGVFYGGLIAAVVVALWYLRRHRMPMWTVTDVFAPGIALGHVDRPAGMPLRRLLLRAADRRAVGDHVSQRVRRAERRARRSTCRSTRRSSTRRAPKLLILGVPARDGTEGPAVPGPDVLGLHAPLRHLAVHHRVLPRRPARHRSAIVLDLAVRLAAHRAARHRDAGRARPPSDRVQMPARDDVRTAALRKVIESEFGVTHRALPMT